MTQRERHQHDYREDDDRDEMQRGRQGQHDAHDQRGMNEHGRNYGGAGSGQNMGRGGMAEQDQGGWNQGRPQAGMSGGGNWGANYGQSAPSNWSEGGRGNMADYNQDEQGQSGWNQGRPQAGMSGGGNWGANYGQGGPSNWSQGGRGNMADYNQGGTGQMDQGRWNQGSRSQSQRGPHSGRGPKGYQRSDDRIREDVCEMLTHHGDIDASEIEIEVQNGEVTLRGTVDSRQTKRMAEDALEHVSGIREINNQLRVSRGDQHSQSGQMGQSQQTSGQSSMSGQQRAVGGSSGGNSGNSGSSTTSG